MSERGGWRTWGCGTDLGFGVWSWGTSVWSGVGKNGTQPTPSNATSTQAVTSEPVTATLWAPSGTTGANP
ncbi:MAG TPA: hypothetical protein VLO31_03640 [Cryobacterium sp.]|nr:hypothetical protein [Cryobacterium sp.]